MLSELFGYLPWKELVACSQVNKRWHFIYAAFKLQRLAIGYALENKLCKWYDTNQKIPEQQWCDFEMLSHLAEKPLLSNLKYLALCGKSFDLNKLNHFRQLVHLEIKVENNSSQEVHLSLPRLKVLAFNYRNPNGAVSIDCPLLSTLVYRGYHSNRLKVKQPETIRKLETKMSNPSWLAAFKNVECLVAEEFEVINKDTLISLPRLKELYYHKSIDSIGRHMYYYEFKNWLGTVSLLKRTLNEFLAKAEELRGSDFRFRFAGLLLTNVKVDEIDLGVQVGEASGRDLCIEYVYMKNYHLIETGALHFVNQVDYNRLLRYATGEFPRCFSQKFTGIYWVKATAKVRDPDHILWFLKSLRFLSRLELKATGFSQDFYDQLPASAPSLNDLYLGEEHCVNELNIDFIRKLSRLSQLKINSALSLESLPLLFRSAGRLQEGDFCFRSRDEYFWIWKEKESKEWNCFKGYQLIFENEDPTKIVNFFKSFLYPNTRE